VCGIFKKCIAEIRARNLAPHFAQQVDADRFFRSYVALENRFQSGSAARRPLAVADAASDRAAKKPEPNQA
jgi:hypothetical protein